MSTQPSTINHHVLPSVHLASFLDTLPDALFFVDARATIQYANAQASAMVGRSPQELPGHLFWQNAPHLVTAALYQAVGEAIRTQQSQEVHYRSPITRSWLRVQLSPTSEGLVLWIHSLEKEPTCFPASVRYSDQRYWDLLEQSAERVAVLTPEGLILEINQRSQQTDREPPQHTSLGEHKDEGHHAKGNRQSSLYIDAPLADLPSGKGQERMDLTRMMLQICARPMCIPKWTKA